MKIKVGDYVRVSYMYNNEKIARVEKILDKDPCYKNMQRYRIDKCIQHSSGHYPSYNIYQEDIIKSSPNLVDLLKVRRFCKWS